MMRQLVRRVLAKSRAKEREESACRDLVLYQVDPWYVVAYRENLTRNLQRIGNEYSQELNQVNRTLHHIGKTYFPELLRKISRLEEKVLELRSIATKDKKLANENLLTWNATALPATLFEELSPDREVSLLARKTCDNHFRKLASLLHPDLHNPRKTGLTHAQAREHFMLASYLHKVYDTEGLLLIRTLVDKRLELSTQEVIAFLEKRTMRVIERKAKMRASGAFYAVRLWMSGQQDQAKEEAEILFLDKIRSLTEEVFSNKREALLEVLRNETAGDDIHKEG